MEKSKSNKDLLLCENQFFLAKNKPENLFNFNNKENNVDKCSKNDMTSFKTEKLTSNVLPRIKDFLTILKSANPADECYNIEKDDDNEDDDNDSNVDDTNLEPKKKVQLDVLLFENENNFNDSSSDSDDEDDS
ncbi:uncharacterized protein LOC113792891 [Dermatophagoides pteronyssinus]|uniref:Uncharacterized transcriptional regulatory protein TBS1-like n=1 Tax=Dermatophagoides pteronyssinus TaxID=6956 RepID=A0A6P6Y2S6_DERPT|nr:uncharacterized transcriptional regulatory protein TBS1-like [Dermatophagoides pteronyssinus]